MTFKLPDPEFGGTSALRDYCERGRLLIRPLAPELRIAAEELKAVLREVPGKSPYLAGVDSRVRAARVASHLVRAAEGVEATVAQLIRTYASFERHFLVPAEVARSPKKKFDLHS